MVVSKNLKERIKMGKEYQREIWVCVSPDNGHWNEKFAWEEVGRIAKKWDVKAVPTSETRDTGFGQERLFLVSGELEEVEVFEEELNKALY